MGDVSILSLVVHPQRVVPAMVKESQRNDDRPPRRWRDYLALTKPRITAMCVMMTTGGYWFAHSVHATLLKRALPGARWEVSLWHMVWAILGSTMVIAGSCALNMYLERDRDRLMKRTSRRPLPTGRLQPWEALGFGLLLSLGGVALLAWTINTLTAALAAIALVFYVGIYTPLKTRTTLFLLVGTIPGAMPPLMGWTAVTNQIDWIGGVLFAILVLWQLPHFLALSVMCQKDYAQAGVQLVAVLHGERQVRFQALLYSLMLLPVSLALIPLQVAGWLYAVVAMTGGLWLITIALRAVRDQQSPRWAPRLFFASLIYLPVLTLGLLIDQLL